MVTEIGKLPFLEKTHVIFLKVYKSFFTASLLLISLGQLEKIKSHRHVFFAIKDRPG